MEVKLSVTSSRRISFASDLKAYEDDLEIEELENRRDNPNRYKNYNSVFRYSYGDYSDDEEDEEEEEMNNADNGNENDEEDDDDEDEDRVNIDKFIKDLSREWYENLLCNVECNLEWKNKQNVDE